MHKVSRGFFFIVQLYSRIILFHLSLFFHLSFLPMYLGVDKFLTFFKEVLWQGFRDGKGGLELMGFERISKRLFFCSFMKYCMLGNICGVGRVFFNFFFFL